MFSPHIMCNFLTHQKRKPYNSKTIEEKYEIIKHYKSIENTGRGAKSKTIEKF